jgi:hypothetical protein
LRRTSLPHLAAAVRALAIVVGAGLLAPAGASATGYVFVTNYTAGTVSPFSIGAGGVLTQDGTGVTSGTGATDTVVDDAVSMDGKYPR